MDLVEIATMVSNSIFQWNHRPSDAESKYCWFRTNKLPGKANHRDPPQWAMDALPEKEKTVGKRKRLNEGKGTTDERTYMTELRGGTSVRKFAGEPALVRCHGGGGRKVADSSETREVFAVKWDSLERDGEGGSREKRGGGRM